MKDFDISSIPPDQRTPLIETLLRIIQTQAEEIEQLKEEIANFKGQKGRPKIKPSSLEKAKRSRDSIKGNRKERSINLDVRKIFDRSGITDGLDELLKQGAEQSTGALA